MEEGLYVWRINLWRVVEDKVVFVEVCIFLMNLFKYYVRFCRDFFLERDIF